MLDRRDGGRACSGGRVMAHLPRCQPGRGSGRRPVCTVPRGVVAWWAARLRMGAPLWHTARSARTLGSLTGIGSEPPVNAPVGLPRLLADIPFEGAMGLAEHLELHGPTEMLPPARLAGERSGRLGGEHPLIAELELSGLRGRGGGAFPTASKLRAVVGSGGR